MEEKITNGDMASLMLMLRSDGFRVMQRIMKQKCEDYKDVLLNADPADHAAVLAAHVMAKTSAQFYESVTKDVNEIVMMFNADNARQIPQDITEGVLDIDNSHTHAVEMNQAIMDYEEQF